MRASCQGCGVTLTKVVPDSCPVCGRTPPVVIAPDTRPEWQQAATRQSHRALLIFVAVAWVGITATLIIFMVSGN